ncbi:hypothetical protein, partial, partial [Parasitella parasitica]
MFHVLNFSAPPEYRHTNDWTIQPMIMPGKNAPIDMDSYLSIVVDEIKDLSNHGMLVRKNGKRLTTTMGWLIGVAKLNHHGGFASTSVEEYTDIPRDGLF